MLDLGFEKDVRAIVGLTPQKRRTVMFTATWPDSVRELASDFLRDPIRVNVGSEALSANHRVTQVRHRKANFPQWNEPTLGGSDWPQIKRRG